MYRRSFIKYLPGSFMDAHLFHEPESSQTLCRHHRRCGDKRLGPAEVGGGGYAAFPDELRFDWNEHATASSVGFWKVR